MVLVSCNAKPSVPIPTPTPTVAKPSISDVFKEQLTRFLEEATTLNAMTEQGVSFTDFRRQLASVKGAYDFASAAWPSDFAPEARDSIEKAFKGWDLTLYLWNLKIENKDNPVEPNINGYEAITTYGGDLLVIEVHPSDFIVPSYRQKKYLPFDENIGVLLSIASSHFDTGRTLILTELQ